MTAPAEQVPGGPPPAALWAPSLVIGSLAVGVFLLWAAVDGGYAPTIWYPGALAFAGLLAVVAATSPWPVERLARPVLAPLAFLGAYSAWSFVSIVWAADRGEAWDAANRTLLYLVVYAAFALWPWRSGHAAGLLGAYSLGVAALGAATYLSALRSDDPYAFFIGGRFAEPVGYINANCALFLTAFWPALFLASRRETPWWLRGAFLASAGFLLELAVLPQSRGSLFAFPLVALLFLAGVPNRARTLLALIPVGLAAFLGRDALLDVYGAARDGSLPSALERLVDPFVASAVVLVAVGTVYGIVDRYLPFPDAGARVASRLLGALVAAASVVAAVVLVSAYGNPIERAQDGWDEFTAGQQFEEDSSYFGASLGSNRYDFWRVAMGELAERPLHGLGAGNFAVAYLRERESLEEPLYPHSLPILVLSQTGIVGGALFLAFAASALAAVWTAQRRRTAFGRAVAAAAVVTFAYWVVHGSVDWFYEFPGLAAPAFAWLGLAAGSQRPLPAVPAATDGSRRRLAAAGGAVLLVFACASFVLPWLAARSVAQAAEGWRVDPARAYAQLERGRRLNFLSDRPDLVAGAIAMRRGDYERARVFFARALARRDESWYAELELGIVAALAGRRDEAVRHLERAQELNPREEAIELVRARLRDDRPVNPRVVDRLFLQRVEDRTS